MLILNVFMSDQLSHSLKSWWLLYCTILNNQSQPDMVYDALTVQDTFAVAVPSAEHKQLLGTIILDCNWMQKYWIMVHKID